MSSDGGEVRELKPRREMPVKIDAGVEQPEKVRSERIHNQVAVQRIAENEARRCLPGLRQAAREAQLGQQVRQMAAYAGETDIEAELRVALEELSAAAAV